MIDSAVLGTLHIGLESQRETQRPDRRREPARNRPRPLVFAIGHGVVAGFRLVVGRYGLRRTALRDPAQP